MTDSGDLEDIQVDLLVEGIYRLHGYDFRGYARASLKRRLRRRMRAEQVSTLSALQDKILHEPAALDRLLLELSINVTAMFRDPRFFLALRHTVVPLLRTYPSVRFWTAGCATGEEVYSTAILLEEEGLLDRTTIYATDANQGLLDCAREGTFPIERKAEYEKNYLEAGGRRELDRYVAIEGREGHFAPALADSVVFAHHNLACDRSFSEFNVILCRNVLIYFAKPLQDRAHQLFYDSLARFGVLGLGQRESIALTGRAGSYGDLSPGDNLYRRLR